MESSHLAHGCGLQRRKKDEMPAEQKKRLDAIGFVWDPHESAWEEGFAALKKFQAREGHCRVPDAHVEGKIKLEVWVGTQRFRRNQKGRLSAEQKQRLDALGFVWNPLEKAWEDGFAALKKFKAREGHCRVPQLHKEGTFRLGSWVGVQRGNRDKMSPKRKRGLDALGFVWGAK